MVSIKSLIWWMFVLTCLVTKIQALDDDDDDDDRVVDLQTLLKDVATTLTTFRVDMKEHLDTVSSTFSVFGQDLKEIKEALGLLKDRVANLIENRTCHEEGKKSGPKDCADWMRNGHKTSGIYRIEPDGQEFDVFCDMETDGGGWTVIQKRGDYELPDNYFNRAWSEYKTGFGEARKEYWLGNDRISWITQQQEQELLVELTDMDNNKVHATYRRFKIESESDSYRLSVEGYSGSAGDTLRWLNGTQFSTFDVNNMADGKENMAQKYKGGWWYASGLQANLNGLNLRGRNSNGGIIWSAWKGFSYSLPKCEMKIRPRKV